MTALAADMAAIELKNQALAMLNLGRYAEAEPVLRQTVEQTRYMRNEHDQVSAQALLWQKHLAESLAHQGKFEEAELLARAAMKGFQLKYGQDDEDMLDCKYLLAWSLYKKKKFSTAVPLIEQALSGLQENRGVEHFTTIKCKALYAEILAAQGKFLDARSVAQSVQELMESVSEKANIRASIGGRKLSEAECRDYQEAKEIVTQVMEHGKRSKLQAAGLSILKGRSASKQSVASTRVPDEDPDDDDDAASTRAPSKAGKA